ncbi:hypothetical protein [Zunongwangia sp. H14]|uniref:hypothetical protein n=1 Tax=Zunongwangia sp. H14 TaxID=3240792 RepID=UPI003567A0AC
MTGKKLDQNLKKFLRHIDAIRDTLPMTLLLLEPYSKEANKKFSKFLDKSVTEIEDDNGEKKLVVKVEDSKILDKLESNASISSLAYKIIPESLFVSLISQYDAFLSRLLRIIYELKPEILNSSERNLTFSQLVDFESLNNARDYIVEKEIDTVLRKSHSEQFDYLESRVGLKLRANLPIWKTFIEITERRNLLVHCDGVVSNQYLKNCKEHKCKTDNIKVGDRLNVKPEYFTEAYKALYEISVKLSHTIWRKLIISDLKEADRKLNDICFDLLDSKSFELADILLSFGYKQNKHFNESLKNVFVINAALSKYLQGEQKECEKILKIKDWSASSDDFKIANAILLEEYETAYSLMIKIGANGEIDKTDYREWPIFTKIRKEKEFQETYKNIFEEDYAVLDTPKRPVQELVERELKRNEELKKKTVKKEKSEKEKMADRQ